jgi:hypothetical protein
MAEAIAAFKERVATVAGTSCDKVKVVIEI